MCPNQELPLWHSSQYPSPGPPRLFPSSFFPSKVSSSSSSRPSRVLPFNCPLLPPSSRTFQPTPQHASQALPEKRASAVGKQQGGEEEEARRIKRIAETTLLSSSSRSAFDLTKCLLLSPSFALSSSPAQESLANLLAKKKTWTNPRQEEEEEKLRHHVRAGANDSIRFPHRGIDRMGLSSASHTDSIGHISFHLKEKMETDLKKTTLEGKQE